MNPENIRAVQRLIAQEQRVYMGAWQLNDEDLMATDIESFHTCGNSACIAGYMALTPEFQAGSCALPLDPEGSGEPCTQVDYRLFGGIESVAMFFDIPVRIARPLIGGITSQGGIWEVSSGHDWTDWDWEDAIEILDKVIDGTIAAKYGLSMEEFIYEAIH